MLVRRRKTASIEQTGREPALGVGNFEDSWKEWPEQGMPLGNWMGDLKVKSKEFKK